jgi:hypothetical protein
MGPAKREREVGRGQAARPEQRDQAWLSDTRFGLAGACGGTCRRPSTVANPVSVFRRARQRSCRSTQRLLRPCRATQAVDVAGMQRLLDAAHGAGSVVGVDSIPYG